jgi:Tol biopolymer transport system component
VVTMVVTSAPEGAATLAMPGASDTPAFPSAASGTSVAVVVTSPTPTALLLATATNTPEPSPPASVASDTPIPPSDTPSPPTDTPVPPTPVATATPKPTAKPQASLASYRIVYGQFDGGAESDPFKYNVWMARGDGKNANRILETGFEPDLAPKGQKVAYFKTFEGIAVYDMAKNTRTTVVQHNYAEFPSFSPDGTKLVFHEWIGNWSSAEVNLYIVNADGSGRITLVPGMRPAWSPKGDLIAFDSCRGNDCGIFVVNTKGQGLREVTKDAGGMVAWSPDGKKLVYSSASDGDPEIWIVNLDGSGRKQLTKNKGNDTMPVFSPDGNYIFFLSDQNGKAWAICAMRADGSDIKLVVKVGVPPRWQFSKMSVGWW